MSDLATRWEQLSESVAAAQALATDLETRLDRLIEQRSAAGDAHSPDAAEQLIEDVAALKERIVASLAVTTNDVAEASESLAAEVEESQSQLEDEAEAVMGNTSELAEDLQDVTQDFCETLADDVTKRLEDAKDDAVEQLERLRDRAECAWSEATRQCSAHIAGVTGDCTERFTRDAQGALQASERHLQRIGQLKEDIERSAERIEKVFSLFTDSIRATQTGLNVTAGTLKDVVEIFSDVA